MPEDGERELGEGHQMSVVSVARGRSSGGSMSRSVELGGLERQAVDLVVADSTSTRYLPRSSRASWPRFISGHQHLVVALQDLAEVVRERVEVAQVDLRDVVAGLADAAHAGADRAVRRAPADHQHLRLARRVVDLERRQRVGDPVDLGLAGADHQVVVGRVVGDVAGAVALLEAADAVLEARRAGDGPRPGQGLLVAQVGPEVLGDRAVLGRGLVVGLGRELRVDARQRRRRPGSATARSRWPGSRRRAASPGCGR